MWRVNITRREHSSNSLIDISIGAYSGGVYLHYINQGSKVFSRVRIDRNSNEKMVIVLGETNDDYSYPKISVNEALIGLVVHL